MIDLDLLESAIKKMWFTRTPEEDGAINRVNDTVGLIELITRLRQAEKDAARYRSANEKSESLISYIGDELSELLKNDYSKYCSLEGVNSEIDYFTKYMKQGDEAMNGSDN